MIARDGITKLLDVAYAPEHDEKAWLEELFAVASAAFSDLRALQAFTYVVFPDGRCHIRTAVGDPESVDLMLKSHEFAEPDDIRGAYFSGPVAQISRVLKRTKNPRIRSIVDRHMSDMDTFDLVGSVGLNPGGEGCALGFANPRRYLPREIRVVLSRVAGHLSTAYRLRESRAPALARLHPDAARVHVETEAGAPELETETLDGLRRAALAIDRAKRFAPRHPDAALGRWKAMVDGRFTLVERFEADGRRLWIAHENEPDRRRFHALSPREAKVVALAALSHPAKLIAYELGYRESFVSTALSRAMAKLGLRSRAELVRLYGALTGKVSSDK